MTCANPKRFVELDSESSTMAEQRKTFSGYERRQFTREDFSVKASMMNGNNIDLACSIRMIQNTA